MNNTIDKGGVITFVKSSWPNSNYSSRKTWYSNSANVKYNSSYKPRKGDLVLFEWNEKSLAAFDHIGIVAENSNSPNSVRTIEGNTSNGIVAERNRTSDIVAYVTPKYNTWPSVQATNDTTTGKPILSWGKKSGAVKYKVYRATSKTGTYSYLGASTGTTFKNTSATAGKVYYYKIQAISSSGKVLGTSNIVSRSCDLAKPKLVGVSNVASSGKIVLKWKDVQNANQYDVYRATSKSGQYTRIKSFNVTPNTGKIYSYTNTSAVAGQVYFYKVKAVTTKNSGANSALSDYMYRTCDLARPVVKIGSDSAGKTKLTWGAVSGASKYEVYRATSKNGTYSKMYTTSGREYVNTGSLTSGKTYYYRVRATKTNNSAATSAYSTIVSRKYTGKPTTSTGNTTATSSVTYTWPLKSHSRITGYWGKESGHKYPYHYGIDIYAATGTNIYAAAPGTVIATGDEPAGYGRYARIRHANGQETLYAHASGIVVKKGQSVQRGSIVGYVGNTGASDGSHLHFGIYKNSTSFSKEYSSHPVADTITYNPLSLLKETASWTISAQNDPDTGAPIISWAKRSGAIRYKVYSSRNKTGTYTLLGTSAGTTFKNTSAVASNCYYYKVQAVSSSGKVLETSNIVARSCDLQRPKLVSIATIPSSGKIELKWADVKNAHRYEIYRATSANGTYSKMVTFDVTPNTGKTYSYINTAAVAGQVYFYKVKAINIKNSAADSALSDYMYMTCDLARPVVKATTISDGKIMLTWDAISGADQYEIYRSTSQDGTYSKMYTVSGTEYVNTANLTSGTTYYYKVRAIDADNSYATSAYSLVVSKTYHAV